MSNIQVHVLLVEDDQELRAEIAEGLTNAGASVKSVPDGSAAMIALTEDPDITVVLTDLRIPGGDGMNLAERVLSKRPPDMAVEVILLTGYATLDTAVEAIRKNIFDFLRKPIRLNDLEASVRRAHEAALGRRGAAKASTAQIARLRQQTGSLMRQLKALESNSELAGKRADCGLVTLMTDGLRSPLVPISGLAEIIEDEGSTLSNDTLTEYARHIRAAGIRLTVLIDAITALAEPDVAKRSSCYPTSGLRNILIEIKHQTWFDSIGQIYHPDVEGGTIAHLGEDLNIVSLILRLCVSELLQTYAHPNAPISLRMVQTVPQATFLIESRSQVVSTLTATADVTVSDNEYASAVRQHATLGLGFRLAMRLADTISSKFEVNSSQVAGTLISLSVPAPSTAMQIDRRLIEPFPSPITALHTRWRG